LITIGRQCSLISLPRSSFYYSPVGITEEEIEIMREIDQIYTKYPFYGVGKITECFRRAGKHYNHKRISRLMSLMEIQALRPRKKLSIRNRDHIVYPYLLRGVSITENNQVWSSDITYLPLYQGFAYLVAVIDWYSRYILSWEISNSLDAYFCLEALGKSLKGGKPKIFNTDQGSQFTSNAFTNMIIGNDIKMSMDGRGRALDNIFIERFWRSLKYEDVYLKDYQSIADLRSGLTEYFYFYNNERFHQSLNYKTPAEVYFN
jgi:putative transposase